MVRLRPQQPTVVLGSSQAASVVDADRALARGVGIVKRRSGGGAVWLDDSVVWFDVVLPSGDRLVHHDVQRAFHWLGELWAEVIRDSVKGVGEVLVHTGPAERSPMSRLICFAGLGPGEVTVDGRKVVGISQRRTRHYVVFQCGLLLRWDPAPLVELMTPGLVAAGLLAADGTGIDPVIGSLTGRCAGVDDASVATRFVDRVCSVN